jgi:ABC-type branched-subunit amino acid transport system ATPase component/branched-subunit amino acid ABC-type transport system permease component
MSNLLPYIVIGVSIGSVYGLAGVGLVLTYKTSGIFNFAHGALATVAAYAFYFLHVQKGIPWPVAAAIVVVVIGPVMGLAFEPLARGLSRTTVVWTIAATVGVLLSVEAAFTILYGTVVRIYPHFLPTSTFGLGGTRVTYEELIAFVLALAGTAALYLFFRLARMGKAMRAVVEDDRLLDLAGTNPTRVRRWAWVIGCTFAAVSGLLLAPSVSLSATGLTLIVVQAFGAAAIGGFSSLPLTWFGGVAIGVAESWITKEVSSTSVWGGLPSTLPFIILFLVVVAFPRRTFRSRQVIAHRPIPWRFPNQVQAVIGVGVLVFLAIVPSFVGFHLRAWTIFLAYVILFLSLSLLVRTSGQVSLCQFGFAAVGAVAFSKLTVHAGVPWLLALILSGLIAVPIGALLAIPAIRLGGLFLALATLGFGLVLSDMFYQSSVMFGTTETGLAVPLPHLSWLKVDTATGFYYVVLAITAVAAALVIGSVRGRLGRVLRGMAESPVALMTSGTSLNVTRVIVFCLSAFLAGIAGALIGSTLQLVNGLSFDPFMSFTALAVIMIIAGGEPWNAVLAGAGLALIPAYVTSGTTTTYLQCFFGVAAVLAALGMQKGLLPERWRQAMDLRLRNRRPSLASASPAPHSPVAAPFDLDVKGLTVRFGGLVAVNDLTLRAVRGRITGLIGPNGAGKTTVFNACSALVRASSGEITFDGHDVSRLGPAARARRGLGRTFQQMELYDSLTVAETVALGREAAMAGAGVVSHVIGRRADRTAISARTREALELCGIESLASEQVGSLSTGQRRLVDLARCVAGPFGFLLLDEPSSGLDRRETNHFAAILLQVVAQRAVGILLVEHDMSMVMKVCDHIFVMDFGTCIFEGNPEQVQSSEVVRRAYLGVESGLESPTMHVDDRAPM